jgi:hypothetical protein
LFQNSIIASGYYIFGQLDTVQSNGFCYGDKLGLHGAQAAHGLGELHAGIPHLHARQLTTVSSLKDRLR